MIARSAVSATPCARVRSCGRAVLVHRHAPSDRDQEELLRQGDAATAGTQPLRAHLGDDAQDTFGHGAAR